MTSMIDALARSFARQRDVEAAADASPILPEFESFDLASGRRGGHPDAMAVGDMASREAVEMVGEIGKGCRLTVVKPGWLVRVEALDRCED